MLHGVGPDAVPSQPGKSLDGHDIASTLADPVLTDWAQKLTSHPREEYAQIEYRGLRGDSCLRANRHPCQSRQEWDHRQHTERHL